ncbi:MAG: hypothetical protein A2987_01660 [Omnitrophica bacterium RIFCSPLOWO2_01_FULL_45_10]|nr:MAG: hypothetical protein A2987_01660 [Omnitrophica bacterium RIFCSPLOWO2_01_FULL_45_10]
MDYKKKIKELPLSPGVYIMKGEDSQILYVGKARNLRKRVSSYFYPARRLSERLSVLIGKIRDIDYLPTSAEAEALLYENSLIKQLSPKYNVALRDDKSYPMLKLTVNEKYPRLFITRQKKADGAIYYGPYTSASLLREALAILRHLFPLRTCGRMQDKLCLSYHIRQCFGPCVDKVKREAYDEVVEELKLFLEGKRSELLSLLTKKMIEASRREEFEEALRYKNRIEVLSSIRHSSITYGHMSEAEELKEMLGLTGVLSRIDAFDVSNIMGKLAVGSLIHFYKGVPRKSEYKRFRIKTVGGIDDYAMMREIVSRRYKRRLEEKLGLPDLILIDGGIGHLNAASAELEKLGLAKIPVISIAKEFEHVYVKDRKNPLILPKGSKALHLLERIRDEAHRFAISYHKKLLSKNVVLSELDNIKGVGPRRKKALLGHFVSVDKIRRAGLSDLIDVEGINDKTARSIIEYFKE